MIEDAISDASLMEESIREAFPAAWKAKPKTAGARKTHGQELAEKKKISTCSSYGQKGHWRGDN